MRALAANAVGATLAYVYLTVVAPPQPEPPKHEALLYLSVAPVYFVIVGLVAYRLTERMFRAIESWLDEGRAPTADERRLVLSLPWRAARHSAIGWLLAAILFGVVTATHHQAVYVAGVVLGIVLAGLTTTGATFLLVERLLRPLFAWPSPATILRELAQAPREALARRPVCWSPGPSVRESHWSASPWRFSAEASRAATS